MQEAALYREMIAEEKRLAAARSGYILLTEDQVKRLRYEIRHLERLAKGDDLWLAGLV